MVKKTRNGKTVQFVVVRNLDLLKSICNMNEIINEFLLAGDNFLPEMHFRQDGFMYSACRPLLKRKKESKNLKKQGIQDIFTKTKIINLDK